MEKEKKRVIFNSDPFLMQTPKQLLWHNHGVSKPGRCVSRARFAAKAEASENCCLGEKPTLLPGCGEHTATPSSESYCSQGRCGVFLVDFFMDQQAEVKTMSESRVYRNLRPPVKTAAACCSLGFPRCSLPDMFADMFGSLQMPLQSKLEDPLLFPSRWHVVWSPQASLAVGVSH